LRKGEKGGRKDCLKDFGGGENFADIFYSVTLILKKGETSSHGSKKRKKGRYIWRRSQKKINFYSSASVEVEWVHRTKFSTTSPFPHPFYKKDRNEKSMQTIAASGSNRSGLEGGAATTTTEEKKKLCKK